jgi:hypothetical protein
VIALAIAGAVFVAAFVWRMLLERAVEIRPHSVTRWRPRG